LGWKARPMEESIALILKPCGVPSSWPVQSRQIIRAIDAVRRCGGLRGPPRGRRSNVRTAMTAVGLKFRKRAATIRQQIDTSCHANDNWDYASDASCRCELGADRGTAPTRSGGDGDSCRPGRRFCLPRGEFGRPLAWCARRAGRDRQRSTRRKIDEFCRGPTAGWFGEGSLLKSEPRRYDGIALRDSSIAFMPRNTFALLLDSPSPSKVSFGFSSMSA
jgi:hypothetical protein